MPVSAAGPRALARAPRTGRENWGSGSSRRSGIARPVRGGLRGQRSAGRQRRQQKQQRPPARPPPPRRQPPRLQPPKGGRGSRRAHFPADFRSVCGFTCQAIKMMSMNSKQPHFAMHPTLPEHKYPSLHSSSEAIRRACLPTPPLQSNLFASLDETLLARAEALAAVDIAVSQGKSHPFKPDATYHTMNSADVGSALANLKIPGVGSLSQSTICRFESLTLSHNNMIALKPILQAWLEEAEGAQREKMNKPELFNGGEKKRKRTSIAAPEKRSLEAYFAVQPRPSSEKIAAIAEKLDLKKNVVRVWFCNQRQKQKRMKFSATY
eukprot:bmy_10472T0